MRKIITCLLPFLLLGCSTGVALNESVEHDGLPSVDVDTQELVALEGLSPAHTDAEYRLPKMTEDDTSDECALEDVRGDELCLCAGMSGNVVHADETWCE